MGIKQIQQTGFKMIVKITKQINDKDGNKTTVYKAGCEYDVTKDFAEKYADHVSKQIVVDVEKAFNGDYENKAITKVSNKGKKKNDV